MDWRDGFDTAVTGPLPYRRENGLLDTAFGSAEGQRYHARSCMLNGLPQNNGPFRDVTHTWC